MKNKKIILSILIIIFVILFMVLVLSITKNKNEGSTNDNEDISDALKIKKEYESLNNKDNNIDVKLKDNNVFIYATKSKIIKTLDSGTDLIFIGKKDDPNSRNIINILNYLNVNRILYLSMENDEIKELLNGYDIKSDEDINCVVIGVYNGEIVGYNINTIDNKSVSEKLDNESINTLKLKLDELVLKVSGESCDIEESEGC